MNEVDMLEAGVKDGLVGLRRELGPIIIVRYSYKFGYTGGRFTVRHVKHVHEVVSSIRPPRRPNNLDQQYGIHGALHVGPCS